MRVVSDGAELAIGTNSGNQLVLTDGTVSRHHCQITVDEKGFLLRDLGSANGTWIAGFRIVAVYLAPGAAITIGETTLRFEVTQHDLVEPLSDATGFGRVIGESAAMRRVFHVLQLAARTDTTILLEGETGTGKTILAEAVHEQSARAAEPFVVVDCGSVSASLIESELFGHERGAFTGAVEAKRGLFESADGGTIFLDEIGELPIDLQPKLLRVLEGRTVTRLGSTRANRLDVRIIAATNRDLRAEVNAGTFRADLFYRISTLRVRVPSLRERIDDLGPLVARLHEEISGGAPLPAELLAIVARHTWPGNVRELRNFIERSVLLGVHSPDPDAASSDPSDHGLAFRDAKNRAVAAWERAWLDRLVRSCNGNLSRAARAGKMDRNYLRDLLRRYDLTFGHDDDP
jgi:transcriptional regulator with GAF, ATPase, and Fis domain